MAANGVFLSFEKIFVNCISEARILKQAAVWQVLQAKNPNDKISTRFFCWTNQSWFVWKNYKKYFFESSSPAETKLTTFFDNS